MIITERDASRISARITIDASSGCWIFPTNQKDGYARIKINGKHQFVHRAAFTYCRGPIPEGLTLDHVRARGCRSRACCNPDHLEPVTHRENCLRSGGASAVNTRKVNCKRGHPLTDDNTLLLSTGSRSCRTCAKARMQAFNEQNPEQVKAYARAYHIKNKATINARSKAWYLAHKDSMEA